MQRLKQPPNQPSTDCMTSPPAFTFNAPYTNTHFSTTWMKTPDFRSYLMSTHFWGPVSNFGIPLAAVLDLKKDEELISGRMTGALVIYSSVFMRYALAVTPKNYLLFGCHVVNFFSQSTQGARWVNYWYMGGKDAKLARQAKAATA